MQDALDHDQDQFYVWLNPELDLYYINSVLSGFTLAPQTGQNMVVIPLNVRELKNPSAIPEDKQPFVTKLQPGDYADILSKDPFVAAAPLDPKRFYRLDTVQVWAPDEPGDYPSGNGLQQTAEITNGQIVETKQTVQVAILFGFTYESIGMTVEMIVDLAKFPVRR